jgi:hypothetical protein
MKKRTIGPGIVVYSDVISDYKNLIEEIELGSLESGIEWKLSTSIINNSVVVDRKFRDTYAIYVPYSQDTFSDLENKKSLFYKDLLTRFNLGFRDPELDYKTEHNIVTDWHDDYGILKYTPGQKVVDHIDDNKKNHRRVSTVYYLNDNYLGGEVVFPRFDITYKPVANELLVFPSAYSYNHSVLPVTEGTRYSIVSWLR